MSSVVLEPPPSKSDAQRALVLSDITGVSLSIDGPLSTDAQAVQRGLATLHRPTGDLDCGDGGAPFRFLVTQAALTPGRTTRLTGTPRLAERPHQPLLTALQTALGDSLTLTAGNPWPLTVQAPVDPWAVTRFDVDAAQSSQFPSSLLLGAARVVATSGHGCEVRSTGLGASAGYLDLTTRWLTAFGFRCDTAGSCTRVEALTPVREVPPLPGDWSSLTYLLPIAWRSGATISCVARGTGHPDERFAGFLEALGLRLTEREGLVSVTGKLSGIIDVSAAPCPDAMPALAAVAFLLPGAARLRDIDVLRRKESDRAAGIVELFGAAGGSARQDGDCLVLEGGAPHAITFDARGDHRLAMAAATLAYLTGVPLALRGAESVAKSFPTFWEQLARVGFAPQRLP